MTFEPEPQPVSAPKWARMPGSVRLKLDHAIAHHLRAHGARHYDLLRDDPAFAPWIGFHLGARGEKRLDRAIADVRRFQKKKLSRSAAAADRGLEVDPDIGAHEPPDFAQASPAQRLAGAGAAIISYDELQSDLRRRRRRLEAAMDACLNEHGETVKPDLYLKLSREHRALVADSASLAKRFHADINSQVVLERVITRVLHAHADDPQSARALLTDINNIVQGAGGIAATGEDA